MAKILLPINNSTWGVHVNPRGVNTYKYVYDFESLDDKLKFVEKELLNNLSIQKAFANLPDVKSMINTRNSPLSMTFNVKKKDYMSQPLDWFLGKDICILELEGNYYFYAIKSIKWDSFDAFTYEAELDIFFTYGEQKFFKDNTQMFILRAHSDRWKKVPAKQGFFVPNLALDSPSTSDEQFHQQDLQYNLANPPNNFQYWEKFMADYQPNWKIIDPLKWRNNIKMRIIPFTARNPFYWKTENTTSNDTKAVPTYQFNKPLINYRDYNYAFFISFSFHNILSFIDENGVTREFAEIDLLVKDAKGVEFAVDDIYSLLNTLFEENLGNTPYTEQNNKALANAELKKQIPTMCVQDTWIIPPIFWDNPNITITYQASTNSLQFHIDTSQTGDWCLSVETTEDIYGPQQNQTLRLANISRFNYDKNYVTINHSVDIVTSKNYVLSPPNDPTDPANYQFESKLLIAPYAYVACYNYYAELKYNIALLVQNWNVSINDELMLTLNFTAQQNYELKNRALYLSITEGYYAQGNYLQNNYNNQHAEYLPSYNYSYTDFMLNNNQSLQNQYNKLQYDQNYATIAGSVAAGLEIIAGVLALFTGAGAIAGAGLIAGGIATGVEAGAKATDIGYEMQGIKAQYQNASMSPHTIDATISSRVLTSLNNLYAPSFRLKSLTPYAQQTVANYFMKNGYSYQTLQDYNAKNLQKSRYWYNYVQLSGCFENIILQVTNEVKEIIEASFKQGITFFHVRKKKDGSLAYTSIKDYSLNNLEMSLYEPPST